ncbi:hypothetical protein PBY51_005648 [Eleginops maclovinus]|uniref:Uncharacterized protein n=1 Tax=Eleginops maclovinus TaxID=56733 RepID=A0AAN8AD77_ELEMC|nr:hypothetical protein PBY51_005648 [Eleginops maclovinus]
MSKRRCRLSGTSRKTDKIQTHDETRRTGTRTTRSRTPDETRSLRALVQHALSVVAAEVLLLLEERVLEGLKQRVTERITAAVEIIFTGFTASRGGGGGGTTRERAESG